MTTLGTIDPELLANHTATLATVGPNGAPQMTAVWFLVEDERIVISARGERQKTKNLVANPLCSLLIYSPNTENYYVEIRGTAVVVPDNDYVVADRIGVRYNADFRTFDGPDSTRVIIDITPERLLVTDVRD